MRQAPTCEYAPGPGCSRFPRLPSRTARLITRPSRSGSIGGLVTCRAAYTVSHRIKISAQLAGLTAGHNCTIWPYAHDVRSVLTD